MADKAYQEAAWLHEKYHEEGLTGNEMAELAGCSRTTIYEWMRRHDIPRDRGEGYRVSDPEPYRSEEWLREKYHDERLSTSEIGELVGCHKQTIKHWLEEHNIPKRTPSEAAKIRYHRYPEEIPTGRDASIHPSIFTRSGEGSNGGYEYVACGVDKVQVAHHRLIATLQVDKLSELKGKHVHHKDQIPWLNYPAGLEVLTPKEHKQRHVE